jgi:hypothetical protein
MTTPLLISSKSSSVLQISKKMRSITLVSFVFFALSGSKVLGASFDLERLRASSSQGINETDFTGKDTVIARLPVMDQIDFNMNEAIQGAALHLDKVLLLEKSSHSDALVSELKNLKTQLISDFERDLIKLAGQGRLPGSKSGTFEIQQFTKLVQEKWSQTAINDLGKWKDSTLARWTQETMTFWRSKKMQLMESLHKDEVSSTCVIGP